MDEESISMVKESTVSAVDDKSKLPSTRKKRLSRKEQKARKKNRQKLPPSSQAVTESSSSKQNNNEPQTNSVSVDQAREEFGATHAPIPVPSLDEVSKEQDNNKGASLGKWFPKAVCLKSSIYYSNDEVKKMSKQDSKNMPKAGLILFYQYKSPQWNEARVSQLISYLTKIANTRKALGGRIRVAPEGVNATVSAVDTDGKSAIELLDHFTRDLKNFDAVFEETDFKFITDLQPDRHFKDIKILPVKELVFYGISEKEAPLGKGGEHLDAKDFHNMLSQDKDSTVVIDVRNHYEAAIGRFDGQEHSSAKGSDSKGAEYIDPMMRKSTDFPAWLAEPATKEKLKDKKVLMYCTGGVRCERASAYLNQKLGSEVKGIYQLQGGIERYLKQYPDGGYWRGKNFVFDKREAIGADNPNGDGGVVQQKKKKSSADKSELDAKCCVCSRKWERYVGKKKCDTCGVPVLMCDSCMSRHKKRKSTDEMLVRCPLCVKENITVVAEAVEYTNNGVSGRLKDTGFDEGEGKAAPSVLKWGGGHATKKKEKRRMKRKLCQFGAECVRKDCFFLHPEREKNKGKKAEISSA